MATCPELDPAASLQFVINAAAGSSDAETKRDVIEAALRAGGRHGELLFCSPAELTGVPQQAATRAIACRSAVVAVGGDGTLSTVAQAAHAVGCVMGVIPYGTFNYFASTADMGGAGGNGSLVAGAQGRAHLGEPASLGRRFSAGLLPYRARELLG